MKSKVTRLIVRGEAVIFRTPAEVAEAIELLKESLSAAFAIGDPKEDPANEWTKSWSHRPVLMEVQQITRRVPERKRLGRG